MSQILRVYKNFRIVIAVQVSFYESNYRIPRNSFLILKLAIISSSKEKNIL